MVTVVSVIMNEVEGYEITDECSARRTMERKSGMNYLGSIEE